jgi:hypothetical protein
MSEYTPGNLIASAVDYRQEPLQVVLLWGVETWLRDPVWMAAARVAISVLRSGPPVSSNSSMSSRMA